MSSASVVPVLDFSLVHTPKGRQAFLDSMLAALRDVGLFYLKNHPVQASLFEEARQECDAFFSLPDVDKAEIDIANVPSFLGYTKLGSEVTANRTDWREHLTISTPHPAPTGGPAYLNLLAPNQWPSPDRLPRFRTVYEQWIEQVSDVSNTMRNLVSEAMGIDPELVSRFFQNQQHRLRLMKYPEIPTSQATDKEQVGLGAHRDKGFSTLIFQASPHRCLQVQTREGVWIDAPPLDNTFVFVAGQALEAMTHGICKAPWHRVVTPPPGLGPRYSIAVGTGIGMDTAVAAKETQEALNTLRDDILQRFPDARDEFRTFLAGTRDGESVGTQYLAQYLASHPDIATRWYPQYSTPTCKI
ncbi:Clavaminate synthase-like protein [Aspergillus pseudonomiae]|uniref:Clavaminate synthase-like protein n=1 Tax=Aspergillus pseudonomiae TaxID=1506151 RepID=A0A5N7DSL9_9EURO|nr:Clavaminate synthase-like protein [Aspergillus pseudonomiae]KAB8266152.1 Clavaminate synthase-like protein [Aspergillus pseudonomiae]KAE8409019.1 Clavaminate synthase-like protein [Aspergillus pseudonomiae]